MAYKSLDLVRGCSARCCPGRGMDRKPCGTAVGRSGRPPNPTPCSLVDVACCEMVFGPQAHHAA
jgi:hypothetical protein